MACDVKCTYATQTLHVCYVQFSGKVGDGGPWQLSTVSHPPSSPFVQRGRAGHRFAPCRALSWSCRVGGCGFLGCWRPRWCLWLPSCASLFLASVWSNVIVCWDRLDLQSKIHGNRWGSRESVFCKSKTLNSQCLGPTTVMNMCTIRGKDSVTTNTLGSWTYIEQCHFVKRPAFVKFSPYVALGKPSKCMATFEGWQHFDKHTSIFEWKD